MTDPMPIKALAPTTILQGDVLARLRELQTGIAHCCVTSPPYWGLRDYGVEGQLGLEATPVLYIAKMVEVFAEVRRVLRDDATLWLNIGDVYAGSWGAQSREHAGKHSPNASALSANQIVAAQRKKSNTGSIPPGSGLKPKDLVGIPWMLAFALRADGWYLRCDIIWSKPNPMPESVRDRPTKAHEYLFLLSKNERYHYDADAIKEPGTSAAEYKMPDGRDTGEGGHGSFHRNGREKGAKPDKQRGHSRRHDGFNDRWDSMSRDEQCAVMRNKRSVWSIATQAFPEAHFATFPEALVRPCILAGCPKGGTVLEPFLGSGTTLAVARQHERNGIGIELNPEYIKLARERIARAERPQTYVSDKDTHAPLFQGGAA